MERNFSPEETELCSKYEIDEEQIMWRRYAIANLCGGDIDQFRQEYPSTPEEAFIMTGSPVFNTDKVLQRIGEVQPADSTGMFTDSGTYYEDSRGYISIWKMPEPNHVYIIGADTAGESITSMLMSLIRIPEYRWQDTVHNLMKDCS